VAGTGGLGFSADGDPAVTAQMHAPAGIAIHPLSGDLFIADTYNHRVRRVYAPQFQLALQIIGKGVVNLKASRQTSQRCESNCTHFYPPNTTITLQAIPEQGMEFKGWSLCSSRNDAQFNLNLIEDIRCQATFITLPTPPPTPPTDPKQPPTTEPVEPTQPPVVKQALPTLSSFTDCVGVEQAASLDLNTQTSDKSVLAQINALPVFQNSQLQMRQDKQQGFLILEQGPLRLSVQPTVAQFSTQTLDNLQDALQLGLQQETLLRLPQTDGKVLDVFAQPAVQNLCALQKHAASLGYPKIHVNGDGNIRLQPIDDNSPWLSLRPDWIATAIEQAIPDGLLFSGTLFPNHYPSLSLISTDSNNKKYQQFFYTAPANLMVLQSAVKNLAIQPFAPWRFTWQAQTYQGIWHQHVQPGSATEFNIKTIADMNGDGTADYRVTYPNGDQQLFFATP